MLALRVGFFYGEGHHVARDVVVLHGVVGVPSLWPTLSAAGLHLSCFFLTVRSGCRFSCVRFAGVGAWGASLIGVPASPVRV